MFIYANAHARVYNRIFGARILELKNVTGIICHHFWSRISIPSLNPNFSFENPKDSFKNRKNPGIEP